MKVGGFETLFPTGFFLGWNAGCWSKYYVQVKNLANFETIKTNKYEDKKFF